MCPLMLTIRGDSLTFCAVWAESALCSQSQRVRLLSCPDTRPDGTNTDTYTHMRIRSNGHGHIYTESALAEFRFHEVSSRCAQQEPVTGSVFGTGSKVIGVCLRFPALPDL